MPDCFFNEFDCSGVCGGLAFIDQCGECSGGTTGIEVNFGLDCNGVCDPSTPQGEIDLDNGLEYGAFIDDCGVCSGGGTDHEANSDQDCAGTCPGEEGFGAGVDDCGACTGGNTGFEVNYLQDCNGDCFGTAFEDDCGACTGGDTGFVPNYLKDCFGICNGDAVLDDCLVCGGDNTTCSDCFGTPNGNAFLDDCGACSGGLSGNIPNSDQDCNGVCYGGAIIDTCGICSEGNTGNIADIDLDCYGVCDPSTPQGEIDLDNGLEYGAFIDDCNYCVGGSTGLEENYADLGCDCDNPAPLNYCVDQDEDGLGDPEFETLFCLEESSGNSYPVIPDDIWILDCTDLDDTCGAIADPNGQYDIGEEFVDENGNGIWDEGELFIDDIEYNYRDCSGVCGGLAFIDYCSNCVGGDTQLEEGWADVGCDCDNPPPLEYCFDTDGDELGNIGTEALFCLEFSENNTYPIVPEEWYNDCSDICFDDPDNDADGDGVCGDVDQCEGFDDNIDTDFDGIADGCDECPNDPDNDADNDEICDDIDECVGDYDCSGVCNGDAVIDECGTCNGDGINDIFVTETTWEADYETVPFENEFQANITAQIFIDGIEQTGGQLAAFGEDDVISALDNDGALFFPPGQNNLYELAVWSTTPNGQHDIGEEFIDENGNGEHDDGEEFIDEGIFDEVMNFKYFDLENNIIIDLNETYTFVINDIVGDGFSPFVLTGEITPCDCDGSVFDDCGVCGGVGVDSDIDGICDDEDICPNDPDNDADGDGICGDLDLCEGFDDSIDTDGDSIPDQCDDCPIDQDNDIDGDGICGNEDPCPNDPFNDADNDTVCGDVDICPNDSFNDIDGDGICCSDGDGDGVIDDPYCECAANFYDCLDVCGGEAVIDDCGICDGNNANQDCNGTCFGDVFDEDNDTVCDDVDQCPGFDDTIDTDLDGIADGCDLCEGFDDSIDTDIDSIPDGCDACPLDSDNDIDGDEICGDVDQCPNDAFNDIDADGICGDIDECPYDSNNDIDADGLCDCTLDNIDDCGYDPDQCPNDPDNDADGDGVCGDVDQCEGFDDNIDTDFDGIADGCDECPNDPKNDADSDGVCGDVDQCPGYDDNIDTDFDGIADGCDDCPNDPKNDADSDGLCADVDKCPYDPDNDADGDGVCGDVDQCEGFDDNIDTDFDGIADGCDECPLDADNDIDGDGVCCSDGDADGVIDDPYCECAVDFYDCAGECGGEAYIDECGICDDVIENDNETCTGCTDDTAENYDDSATISCDDDCCEYAPLVFNLLTPVDGTEIVFDENDYDDLFINFSWEESIDFNVDDQILYNIYITNENTGELALVLEDYPQEFVPVNLSFIIDDPIENEDVLFSWEVIAQDDSDGQYETNCNEIFEFTLRFESLGVDDALIPDSYILGDSYPNPFNPVTTIEYGLPEVSNIKLSVYDIHGKLIETLDEGSKVAGYYSVVWNAQNIPTGTYFIRFSTPEYSATRKVSLIK